MSDYNLAITALRSAYLAGRLGPAEVIFSCREKAIADWEYGAWITLLSQDQLQEYLTALEDKVAASGMEGLPLYGIPFAIKDNIDLAATTTTAACPDFSYVPANHATVVSLLIEAGAIPLGKTNMDQFATGLVGTRSPYGEGRNVFNKEYISGGSSAGSAIACALGQVSFALGTDTAGSGRVPAALNNLIGLKPSKGLLSTQGVVPACRSLDCVSIFALDCDDAATVFELVCQYDAEDPFSRHNRFPNQSRYYQGPAPGEFRFGVPDRLEFQGNTESEALFYRAVETLTAMGGQAVSIDFAPFHATARLLYEGPWVAERRLATTDVADKSMLEVIRKIIRSGDRPDAEAAFAAQYRLASLKRQCDQITSGLEFVLTPTIPVLYTREEINQDPVAKNSVLGTYTNFMNLLDYCATSVPVAPTGAGPYWGVTLFADAFFDMKVLNFASELHKRFSLPAGATNFKAAYTAKESRIAVPDRWIEVVVCGAHLSGQPLNWQLTDRRAVLRQLTSSAGKYRLYVLPDGKRPAMQRVENGGVAIEVEVWSMPAETFGSFVAAIPAPLAIGKVELHDGRWVSGFICDAYGLESAQEISAYGGWRNWLASKK